MSNPKVFEYAKEIGMTPLALMDKIREWHLPVKSHMAELEPEVLEQLKGKLGGKSAAATEKPKKVAARKVAPKKTESLDASSAAAKTPVVRRKSTPHEEAATEGRAKIISRPEVEKSTVIAENPVQAQAAAADAPEVKVKKTAIVETAKTAEETIVVAKTAKIEHETAPIVAPAAPKIEATSVAPVSSAAAATVATEAPKKIEVKAPEVRQPARKKEVVVGTSGIASSSTPAAAPRRNIIGRMDLSRVQQPQRPQSGGSSAAYSPNRDASTYNGQQGAQGGGGFNNNRAGGFSSPARPGVNRGIRAGFVAPAQIPDFPPAEPTGFENRREKNKKFQAGPAVAAPAATVREEEAEQFNAVEFRKREMVFQPKKKKGMLDRVAMKTQITTPKAGKRVVKVMNVMKLSDLANEMGLKATQITKALMQNGVMATMSTDLDFDTISLIVPEFGWEAQNVFKTADDVALETAFGDLTAEPITRPPVVTVMGHVDHGKTSLLDAIRNAKVASGEAGGITQHIGAYSVKLEDQSLITFLDTPGHEAFTAMRSRGANATDIAVIVVAADDGMMPQTAEAINHAKAAGVQIIVAVNKMDKPGANPEKIKQQLTEFEIVPEEWGGNTIFCEVSALKKTGINELLEQIKLTAEILELKANPKRSATGLVIEAKVEKGKGSVATILVKDGTVKVGQYIVAGSVKGRIRSLMNDRGERVQEAGPGLPVEVQGLESTPAAGDKFDIVKDEDTAVKVSQLRKEQIEKSTATPNSKMSLEDIFSKVKSGDVKELTLVLKSDVHGSLEAIQGMLSKLSTAEVKTRVIHAAVGGINESDVLLAHTAKGIVIGFNVRPDTGAQAKAKQLGVDVRNYSIVYELVDEMKKAMAGMLTPDIVEKVMGRAEVRNTFTVPKIGTIAGCFVVDGKIQRSNSVRLLRDGKIVYVGKLGSLKRFKDDAKEVATGFECGIGIENFNDLKTGDVVEAFMKEEVVRELGVSLNP